MTKSKKLFYIGTRHNPQLKQPYYTKYGQLSKKDARKIEENCLYGSIHLVPYDSEEDYLEAIAILAHCRRI
jgi:hypothetical protein